MPGDGIIESSQKTAYQAVDTAFVQRNRLLAAMSEKNDKEDQITERHGGHDDHQ